MTHPFCFNKLCRFYIDVKYEDRHRLVVRKDYHYLREPVPNVSMSTEPMSATIENDTITRIKYRVGGEYVYYCEFCANAIETGFFISESSKLTALGKR